MRSSPVRSSHFFECQRCGVCCKGYGGTHVTAKDIAAIADYLGSPVSAVRDRFCVMSGNKTVLAQRPDGYCIFFDNLCTIHPVKPLMCRRWPFIPGVLADAVNWRVMADACPGINPDVDVEALQAYTRSVLDGEDE